MKKTIPLLITLMLLAASISPVGAFTDVQEKTPYGYEITWLEDNGVVSGSGYEKYEKFHPGDCVNRAEFLKMMYKLLESDIHDLAAGAGWAEYFSDVDTQAWYWDYLRYALQTGSVTGYPDKTFRPNQCVNRVEAVKMAVLEFNGGKVPKYAALTDTYVDISHATWYSSMLDYAIAANILGTNHREMVSKGIEGNRIKYLPAGGMTRGEVAYLLFNLKALKDNNVIANNMAYDKEKVNYNDERGMLMPKKLSTAYAFDGCGKTGNYTSESWWKTLQTTASAAKVDLTKVSDMCFSKEKGVVIFITQAKESFVSKESSKEGFVTVKIKIHKFTTASQKLETPTVGDPFEFAFEEKDAGPKEFQIEYTYPSGSEIENTEFGKRKGDFIIFIAQADPGAYYEYYFGKNTMIGSYKMIHEVGE